MASKGGLVVTAASARVTECGCLPAGRLLRFRTAAKCGEPLQRSSWGPTRCNCGSAGRPIGPGLKRELTVAACKFKTCRRRSSCERHCAAGSQWCFWAPAGRLSGSVWRAILPLQDVVARPPVRDSAVPRIDQTGSELPTSHLVAACRCEERGTWGAAYSEWWGWLW